MDIIQEPCYTNSRNVPYEELTLADDFMFYKVMQNESLCHDLLEVILGVEIEKIVYVESQKVFKEAYDGKGVRLDVYVKDNRHTVYNIEMQTTNSYLIPKRTRYYHASIDKGQLKPGESYDNLPNSYVIFICTFDLFGKGIALYTFESICSEIPNLHLEDGRYTIFINMNGITDNDKLKEFLNYLRDGTITNSSFIHRLDDAVKLASANAEWKEEYEMLVAREQDLINLGKFEILLSLIEDGTLSVEKAAEKTQHPESFIKWFNHKKNAITQK